MNLLEAVPKPYQMPVGVTVSKEEAFAFCHNLAKTHYENFIVASLLLPKDRKQHFYNLYAYCRIADDLADEVPDPQTALQLLDWWDEEVQACYAGQPRHPVFVALSETIKEFDIPITPFRDLLIAFRQDQIKTRYQTYEELLEYCRYSANPVGRLVLYICGYRDEERFLLSDCTCTALQLANHWQDVALDLKRNRIYLPLEDMQRFSYSEEDLFAHRYDERFIALMRLEVERARQLFHEGLRLVELVAPKFRADIELFNRAGLEVLRRIEKVNYDVFNKRPTLSKRDKAMLLFRLLISRVSCFGASRTTNRESQVRNQEP